tara:strand:- start:20 stop:337 length:318 start_codon:yes stop_codon:yes gene_type:complete
MNYKKLMGYGDKKKVSKPKKNKVLESIKKEFGYNDTINEGPSYEYAKVLKDIEKGENIQAKAVNNFVKVLKKKGFPKEATNVASVYMVNMRKFRDYIEELTDKLL